MEIYLIRHTTTATNPGFCHGQSDVPLAVSFDNDVTALHNKLPEFNDDCLVFSSPLSRCLNLAETFSDTVQSDDRLQELNFGDWEGKRFDDLPADVLRHWTENYVTAAPPNGESFTDLYQRAGEFWKELLATKAEQVLIVTHAGIIRALLANALSLPLTSAFQLRIDSSSVSKLRYSDDFLFVEYVNL